jgi:uncharacterized protein
VSPGHVAVFPLEANLLLVVFGQKDVTMGLFNVAARGVLSRLREAIVRRYRLDARVQSPGDTAPGQR